MTNEEAKKNLLAYAYYVDEPMPPDVAKALDMAIKALEQPEPCEDTISRQQAIDDEQKLINKEQAIDKIKKRLFETALNNVGFKQDVDKTLADVAENRLENWFNELPSAQPERTCVNCGRTANNGGWYADGRTRCPIEEHYALPKDGYCHLWEKRNVTDDDYPERREDG